MILIVQQVQVEQDQNTWNAFQDQNWIFFSGTMNNEIRIEQEEVNENKSRSKDE
jgi:hypothetical protein